MSSLFFNFFYFFFFVPLCITLGLKLSDGFCPKSTAYFFSHILAIYTDFHRQKEFFLDSLFPSCPSCPSWFTYFDGGFWLPGGVDKSGNFDKIFPINLVILGF
jgi:hypothetical protein